MGKELRTLKQIRGALPHPAFMLLICVSVTIFLLTVILPKFTDIYADRGAMLLGATRELLATSNVLIDYWPIWLGGMPGLILAVSFWVRTTPGRTQFDWLKLNVLVLKGVFSKFYLSRACRTIESLTEAGVSILDTIGIVKLITRNVDFDRLWERADADIRTGQQISDTFMTSPLVSKSFTQMIQSGEKSGRLSLVFGRLADFTEQQFDQSVKNITQFIEPVMIMVMGSTIGFITIALLAPMFTVGKVVAGG